MQCLVTGKLAPPARLHPSLKSVRGAQSSGATLVGFNAAAYESYNRSQGQNAPVSEDAAFAYTTTLNYLLSDANPNKKLYLGDTTVVYWAESDNRAYEPAFAAIIDPAYIEEEETEQTGRKKAEAELQLSSRESEARPGARPGRHDGRFGRRESTVLHPGAGAQRGAGVGALLHHRSVQEDRPITSWRITGTWRSSRNTMTSRTTLP